MKSAPAALAFLLAAASAASAQDDRVGVRGRYWYATLRQEF